MSDSWRVFIAVELPRSAIDALTRTARQLQHNVPAGAARWVRPESIHLTLFFVGEIKSGRVDEIVGVMEEAAQGIEPFSLKVEGLGCFPNIRRPRVLWAGVAGDVDPLRTLQGRVQAGMETLGFAADFSSYVPHLTLARTNRKARAEDYEAISRASKRQLGVIAEWQVDGLSLMRTHLRPSGSHYEQLAHVALAQP
jgi:2'-5' RNA ligase